MTKPEPGEVPDHQAIEMAVIEDILADYRRELSALDHVDNVHSAAILLGRRVISLYYGLRHASAGPSEAACHVILRALADAVVTIHWIWLRPDVHVRLWEADADRLMLKLGARVERSIIGDRVDPTAAAEVRRIRFERIEAARQLLAELKAAGVAVKGVDADPAADGRLMPDVAMRAQLVARVEVQEAHDLVLGWASSWVHSDAASFAGTPDVDPGSSADRALENVRGVLLTAQSACAIALGPIGRELSLGWEPTLERIRLHITKRRLPA